MIDVYRRGISVGRFGCRRNAIQAVTLPSASGLRLNWLVDGRKQEGHGAVPDGCVATHGVGETPELEKVTSGAGRILKP